MFVRKKLNNGGSFTVLLQHSNRVPGKKFSATKTVKNFGSARGKRAIAALVKKAETYKAHLESLSPKPQTLKIVSDLDIKSCRSFNTGFSDVYGHCFDSTFSGLGLKPHVLSKLRELVVMRIAAPASKLKTIKLASEYHMELANLQVDSIYTFMDKIKPEVIGNIKKTIYNHTAKLLAKEKRTIDVLFYDLTTVSFETNTQDDIRNFGFSKDGKHNHVQVMLALIVTKDGLPLEYEEFPGNCFEGHTLIPVLTGIRQKYNIDKVVMVADAALMSKINLKELNDHKINYVIAARIKSASKQVQQAVLDIESYETISASDDDNIKAKVIEAKLHVGDESHIVVYHSAKRARKDEHDRQKDLDRIKQYLTSTGKAKLTYALKKSYIKVDGCKIQIDDLKLTEQKRYDGFFGLHTNIKNPNPKELLSLYRGLWQVEQTFRIAKTNLEIRPVFHYNPKRIKVHFVICYVALAMVRYVEFILKCNDAHIPCDKLHLLLAQMRKTVITVNNETAFEILEDPPPELIPVYKSLKISWPRKFSHAPVL